MKLGLAASYDSRGELAHFLHVALYLMCRWPVSKNSLKQPLASAGLNFSRTIATDSV